LTLKCLRGEPMDSSEFPEKGILWRGWSDETLLAIREKDRPVLLFVANPNTPDWPAIKAVFKEMPRNEKLRNLLHQHFIALFIKVNALPELLRLLGAGDRFHIAVLSPYGLTPMVTTDATAGSPGSVVSELVRILETLLDAWR